MHSHVTFDCTAPVEFLYIWWTPRAVLESRQQAVCEERLNFDCFTRYGFTGPATNDSRSAQEVYKVAPPLRFHENPRAIRGQKLLGDAGTGCLHKP